MFDKVKQLGDLNKLRKQAMQMQQALAQEEIVVEAGDVRVVISGDQKIKTIEVRGEVSQPLINAVNEAIKKSQQLAAQKLSSMRGFSDMMK